jgi:hypothetical protein
MSHALLLLATGSSEKHLSITFNGTYGKWFDVIFDQR